jgi:2-isopropylmalate synthase
MLALLDELGMDYIEAGNPASNPKERAFFEQASGIRLARARLVAFGSTCRKQTRPEDDPGVRALLSAGTPAVAVFGKAWDLHVTQVLGASLDENLAMVRDTLRFFKEHGREVIFDAEHFFDGYAATANTRSGCWRPPSRAGRTAWRCATPTAARSPGTWRRPWPTSRADFPS